MSHSALYKPKYICGAFALLFSSSHASAVTLEELLSQPVVSHQDIFNAEGADSVYSDPNIHCRDFLKTAFEQEKMLAQKKRELSQLEGDYEHAIEVLEYENARELPSKKNLAKYGKLKKELTPKIEALKVELRSSNRPKKDFNACVTDNSKVVQTYILERALPQIYDTYYNSNLVPYGDEVSNQISKLVPEEAVYTYFLQTSLPLACSTASDRSLKSIIKYAVQEDGNVGYGSIDNLSWDCPTGATDVIQKELMPKIVNLVAPVREELTKYRDFLQKEREKAQQQELAKAKAEKEAYNKRLSQLREGIVAPQTFDEVLHAIGKFNNADGLLIFRPQSYQPFDNAYVLGVLDAGDINSHFRGTVRGRGSVGYFEVLVSDKTKIFSSQAKGQPIIHVSVVGKYARYKSYQTTGGDTRYMPVIEADYISY